MRALLSGIRRSLAPPGEVRGHGQTQAQGGGLRATEAALTRLISEFTAPSAPQPLGLFSLRTPPQITFSPFTDTSKRLVHISRGF